MKYSDEQIEEICVTLQIVYAIDGIPKPEEVLDREIKHLRRCVAVLMLHLADGSTDAIVEILKKGLPTIDALNRPNLNQVDSTPLQPIGEIHRTLENGPMYCYMEGIGGLRAGHLVTYDVSTYVLTGLCKSMVLPDTDCAAGAMADIGAGRWGWFQIKGLLGEYKP